MTVSTSFSPSIDESLKSIAKSLARVVSEWDRSGKPRKELYYRICSAKHILCDVSDTEDQIPVERVARVRH